MTDTANDPATGSEGQSVNAPSAPADNAISALANYRARQAASTTATQAQQQGGAAGPDTGATPRPDREQFIPRERFDEVNTKLKSEVESLKEMVTQLTQQRHQPQFGPAPTQQPQPQNPTGMVGAQPSQLPDFNDPAVKKQWSERMYKDPVPTLFELVGKMIEAQGTPLLQQFQQQIAAQITPLQQTFVQNQLAGYEQRAASDPSFATIRPTFASIVDAAVQRGIPLTEQNLRSFEGIARAQHGIPFGQPAPTQPAPFSERPGGTGQGQQPQVTLNSEQRKYAQLFGKHMTEAEYASWFERNGVS